MPTQFLGHSPTITRGLPECEHDAEGTGVIKTLESTPKDAMHWSMRPMAAANVRWAATRLVR
jgi:hypothetical protein